MLDVLRLKAKQYATVHESLFKTKTLVCIDGFSNYWGCGMKEDIAPLCSPKEFPGQNKLGELWMGLKEEPWFVHIRTAMESDASDN